MNSNGLAKKYCYLGDFTAFIRYASIPEQKPTMENVRKNKLKLFSSAYTTYLRYFCYMIALNELHIVRHRAKERESETRKILFLVNLAAVNLH